MKKITYKSSGVDYSKLDPIKKLAQTAAFKTGKNLTDHSFSEISDTRGESAYVWKQGNSYMATVIEGLGTKNLVADEMRHISGKTYYDAIGHDTISAIINDLISVGARPLTVHAYWAVGDGKWLEDEQRMRDLIRGWKSACDSAGASWGGGETPTYKGIINPDTIDLGGSAVGFVKNKNQLLLDKNIKIGDRIIFLKSTGINVNGLTLARKIAKKLPKGYRTKLKSGEMYGDALLVKSNIYAKLLRDIFDGGVNVHYVANITGHGLRKIMRAKQHVTYHIERIFEPQEVFTFIQKHAGLTDEEMYGTYNMGQDYALFISESDVAKTLRIIKKNKFQGLDAGVVKKGKKQVIIEPKKIVFTSEELDLR